MPCPTRTTSGSDFSWTCLPPGDGPERAEMAAPRKGDPSGPRSQQPPLSPASWPAHLRPMCLLPGQGSGLLVLWLPNPPLAERKRWVCPAAWRVAGGSGRERKIHGPSNGTCASEAAPAIHIEINHCQERQIKGAGTQGPVLWEETCRGGLFPGPLQSGAAGLPGAPETCLPHVFPRPEGTGFPGPRPGSLAAPCTDKGPALTASKHLMFEQRA